MPLQSTRDRELIIRTLPNFNGLDDAAIGILAENARYRRFKKGAVIYARKEAIEHGYILVEGRIRVQREGGREIIVERPGGIGFLSAFAGETHGVDAVAQEEVRALELPLEVILDITEENFSFVRNSLRLQSRGVVSRRGGLPAKPGQDQEAPMGTDPGRPATLVEKVLSLRSGGAFADGNSDALIALARATREIRVESGHCFWKLGEPAEGSLRIQYGRVRCTNEEGASVVVGAGYVLGGLNSFGRAPHSYAAEAVTPVVGFRLPREAMLNVLETHPSLARRMLATFSRMLIDG